MHESTRLTRVLGYDRFWTLWPIFVSSKCRACPFKSDERDSIECYADLVNTLGEPLKAIWGEASFGIFELAPLCRREVLTALSANGIDPQQFIPKLFGARAVAFAIKPLTLRMLLSLYKRDGCLPSSTADLYCQSRVALRCM